MNSLLQTTAHLRLTKPSTYTFLILALLLHFANAGHHWKHHPTPKQLSRRATTVPLTVKNSCTETIWPGLLTQSGNPRPSVNGFELTAGSSRTFQIAENWQGRVWGRTNCSFTSGGTSSKACGTGDCGSSLSCIGTGEVPTTLAEFTLDAGDGHTYYDLSLVDGYNLPIAIEMLPQSNSSLEAIPLRLTNPSCVATVGEVAAPNFNPYSSGSFLGTTSASPLPFENNETLADIAEWCPWNLQVSTSTGPNGGVYIYPDGNLNRPSFDPCYSACAKSNSPADCCTGSYDSPSACSPSSYSKAAKAVCPDAYSYAFDDQTSTFIIPSGAGFEVIFCPGARSTNIIATYKNELVELSQGTLTTKRHKRQAELTNTTTATTSTGVSTDNVTANPTATSTGNVSTDSTTNSTAVSEYQSRIISTVFHNDSAAYDNVTLTFVLSGGANGAIRNSMAALWIAMIVGTGLTQWHLDWWDWLVDAWLDGFVDAFGVMHWPRELVES